MLNKTKQKRNVYISAGHTDVVGDDRGAQGNGFFEGELTVELRDLICMNLDELCVTYKKDENAHALSKTIRAFRNLVGASDLVIDIHFNAATPSATGCEAFVPNNPSSLELNLAEKGVNTIAEILRIPLRGNYKGRKGVKDERQSHHQQLGWMRLTGHNVLYEICFISNANDMIKYQRNKEKLARAIALDICSFVYSNDSTMGGVNQNKMTHVVVKGDTLSGIAQSYGLTVEHIKNWNGLKGDTIYVGQVLKL